MSDRIAVGLDVHARSTHACAIDEATGEVRRARMGPDREEVIRWLKSLGGDIPPADYETLYAPNNPQTVTQQST